MWAMDWYISSKNRQSLGNVTVNEQFKEYSLSNWCKDLKEKGVCHSEILRTYCRTRLG